MPSYQEQFERVKRYYEKFSRLNAGMRWEAAPENYTDDVYAFFQNCWHLKDWLENDPAFGRKTEVAELIKHPSPLALCRDICVGLKHLKPNSKPASGAYPSEAGRTINISINEGNPEQTIAIQFAIDHNGTRRDAFTVATECLQAWADFLK